MSAEPIELARSLVRNSRRAVILTGAGVSTPSGIADFRTPGTGEWSRVDPLEVATIQTFLRNPLPFFEWFSSTAIKMAAVEPNPAHRAIAEMERRGIACAVVTQNIDGLHQRAGSRTVLEVHGSWHTSTCVKCGEKAETEPLLERFLHNHQVPTCSCGGVFKPDIVMYGESLSCDVMEKAQEEIAHCDLLLIAGSSLAVAPVSDLPWRAIERRTPVIVCNREVTWAHRYAQVTLRDDVATTLPALLLGG